MENKIITLLNSKITSNLTIEEIAIKLGYKIGRAHV